MRMKWGNNIEVIDNVKNDSKYLQIIEVIICGQPHYHSKFVVFLRGDLQTIFIALQRNFNEKLEFGGKKCLPELNEVFLLIRCMDSQH